MFIAEPLLQLRVLGLGLLQDRIVRVGIFQRVRKSWYAPFAVAVSPDTDFPHREVGPQCFDSSIANPMVLPVGRLTVDGQVAPNSVAQAEATGAEEGHSGALILRKR